MSLCPKDTSLSFTVQPSFASSPPSHPPPSLCGPAEGCRLGEALGGRGTVELLAGELDLEACLPKCVTLTHSEDHSAHLLLPPSPLPLLLNFNLWICLSRSDRPKISWKSFQPWRGLPAQRQTTTLTSGSLSPPLSSPVFSLLWCFTSSPDPSCSIPLNYVLEGKDHTKSIAETL